MRIFGFSFSDQILLSNYALNKSCDAAYRTVYFPREILEVGFNSNTELLHVEQVNPCVVSWLESISSTQ